jgi:hypothetical protein
VKLGTIYDPVENLLSSSIEDPIEDKKRAEIKRLRAVYTTDSSLQDLRSRLDDVLVTDGIGGRADRTDLLKQVDGIIAKKDLEIEDRVRDTAVLIYSTAGHDVVKDLIKQSGT